MSPPSDDGIVRDHLALGHHHDAFADVTPLVVLVDSVAGIDHHVSADGGVLVDDRFVNPGVLADLDALLADFVATTDFGTVVVVRSHDDGVGDLAAGFDDRAHADDGSPDRRAGDDTPVREQGLFDHRIVDLAGRQESSPGVNRIVCVEEIELRHDFGTLQVGLVERADRADVLPVALKDVAIDIAVLDDRRNDVFAEIFQVVVEGFLQDIAVEQINPHGSLETLGLTGDADGLKQAGRHLQLVEELVVGAGFFDKTGDAAALVGLHQAEGTGRFAGHRSRRDGEVRSTLVVLFEHGPEVHPVELVAAEDEVVFVGPLQEILHILAHGIGGALIPVVVARSLLGREDVDEVIAEMVELVAAHDVAIERLAVELGQHIHLPNFRVDAVADRDIDDAVFAGERHRRF